MKKVCIYSMLLFTIFLLSGCSNNEQPNKTESNTENIIINNNEISENPEIETKIKNATNNELSYFSTKLTKDISDEHRDHNIKIACSKLNNTVVKSNDTFSFWKTIGNPTENEGYEKAKAFDSDGDVIQAYGGGLCQISTTLYNAVLNLDKCKITERHEHSNDVLYIKDGKDAAVSYNTADLKFKNNYEYDLRIEAKVEDKKIKISIFEN